MVTAYDAPGARMADEAGVDLILVGDSVAMVVLGYDDTLQVTVDDLAHHTAAVARGLASSAPEREAKKPFVVADLPWMSYHTTQVEAVQNAAQLIRAGAQGVKLEGGRKRLPMIEAIIDAEIPVMGHLGLTPQSVHAMGGFKVQGREHSAALELVADAKALAAAGCFAIVLEGVPDEVARMVTDAVDVPTVGIGAGPGCDGQVLVYHDVLGIEDRILPKFVRRYADLKAAGVEALAAFAADVRSGAFPAADESYHLSADVAETLGLYGLAASTPSASEPPRRHPAACRGDPRRPPPEVAAARRASCWSAPACGPSCSAAPTAPPTRSSARTRPDGVHLGSPGDPDRVLLEGFDELAVTVDPGDGSLLAWCLLAALNAEQRARGLMEVTDLQGYSGMAFVYEEDVQNAFYMRNTPTPLSIAWIAADGSVVTIADMEPCEDRDGCPSYAPSGPYRYAIEVPQGDLPALGITESSNVRVGGSC